MVGEDSSTVRGFARAFGIPPKKPLYFVVNTQLCAAVLMVSLGLACLWASSQLARNDVQAVASAFRGLGLPGESRPEIWLLGGELLVAWALCCTAMALYGARAVKRREARTMWMLVACQTVSALIAGGAAAAMNNYMRWPMAIVAFLWLWTVWGYCGIVSTWRAGEP